MSHVAILLFGCAESSNEKEAITNDDTYKTAIQNGMDELELDNFEKAEAYFEISLEEKVRTEEEMFE